MRLFDASRPPPARGHLPASSHVQIAAREARMVQLHRNPPRRDASVTVQFTTLNCPPWALVTVILRGGRQRTAKAPGDCRPEPSPVLYGGLMGAWVKPTWRWVFSAVEDPRWRIPPRAHDHLRGLPRRAVMPAPPGPRSSPWRRRSGAGGSPQRRRLSAGRLSREGLLLAAEFPAAAFFPTVDMTGPAPGALQYFENVPGAARCGLRYRRRKWVEGGFVVNCRQVAQQAAVSKSRPAKYRINYED